MRFCVVSLLHAALIVLVMGCNRPLTSADTDAIDADSFHRYGMIVPGNGMIVPRSPYGYATPGVGYGIRSTALTSYS